MATQVNNREYIGPAEANIIQWKVKKEYEGRKNWRDRWGPFMDEHNKWVCSGISRALRKPSFRSLEWLSWQRKLEVPSIGELNTRKELIMEPKKVQCCNPCPWPITTSGEVGWLGQHRSCQLEIYGNDFMKKPPLPWYITKFSQ